MTEIEFHNQRKIFAILDNKLYYGDKGLSHYDWLVGNKIIPYNKFNNIIRGYVDDTGIYFYKGDFKTDPEVEKVAKEFIDIIDPIKKYKAYCGVIKGIIGDRWKPITEISR